MYFLPLAQFSCSILSLVQLLFPRNVSYLCIQASETYSVQTKYHYTLFSVVYIYIYIRHCVTYLLFSLHSTTVVENSYCMISYLHKALFILRNQLPFYILMKPVPLILSLNNINLHVCFQRAIKLYF